ncbi:MAG TPA: ATP-binding protein [Ignavibacteriales bacterium]|nr:ATP-binding protein [Ignavibacteriales bacterium]
MKISVERKVTIWFILVLCLGLFFTYLAFKSRTDYVERGNWVRLSYNIQTEIGNINDYFQQIEINSHRYLLTGRKECVRSYNTALDSLKKSIQNFSELTKDNPRQQEFLRILSKLNSRKQEGHKNSFEAKDSIGRFKAFEKEAANYNQSLVDSLKIVISQMDSVEDMRLDERLLSQENASAKSASSLITLASLFLLTFGIFYWLILDDIKKRKRAEARLAKKEAFLYMIFNEANDALFLVDSKTNLIEKCNKAALRLFKAENKQDLLKTFSSRLPKPDIDQSEGDEINEAIKNDGVWKSEVIFSTDSGCEFWGAVSIIAFEADSKKHKLVRIIDITERKNSEKALKTYAEALEESKNRLQALTSELLVKNNELKMSEAALKDLNASKDKFFSILAHDMRSPFTGLLGIAEYMADCQDMIPKDEMKELSEAVYASAKKVYGLLNNLLEWSRLQMGKIEYLPSDTNLKDITSEITDLQRSNAESKDICLKNEISSSIHIYADQNMVATILRNLVSNAIKFTDMGGAITLSAQVKDSFAEISVNDTGIGMSEEVKDKIFSIDSKHTTKGTSGEEGTGLGLVLCKELIEKNHGNIRVNSRVGRGTEFIFTLPLAPVNN